MTRFVALLVAALLTSAGPRASAEPPADGVKHLQVSAGLAAGGYIGATLLTEEPLARAGLGCLAALTLGGLKEGADAAGLGDASWRDMGYNALGAVTGALLAWLVDLTLAR